MSCGHKQELSWLFFIRRAGWQWRHIFEYVTFLSHVIRQDMWWTCEQAMWAWLYAGSPFTLFSYRRRRYFVLLALNWSIMICIGHHVGGHTLALQHGGRNYFLLISCETFDSYVQMCYKRYHIIFGTFSLKFKGKIFVQKAVIHNVAKWNLGKVNLKPMQSAVAPISVCDLRGDP